MIISIPFHGEWEQRVTLPLKLCMSHSKFHLYALLMAVTPLMGHYEKGDASRGHLKDSNQPKLIYIKIQRKKGRNRG